MMRAVAAFALVVVVGGGSGAPRGLVSLATGAGTQVVVRIDGDTHAIPRDLLCLTTAIGEPITLWLKGDAIFSDGFENGSVAQWRMPLTDPVDPCQE